ncbi:MAG: nickel-dependent hydrogenase large subunit [Candidatus Thiodiazotropha sp. (ex Myrtea sp. 'scaly one' KF741663)]|nr:nickel-dependent hydrogenase large subunit [Candidatus Thiodiazotropha sp. (ex Myrtea sp. 'scaly one' KF741663)]
MSIEGELRIELQSQDQRVRGVTIQSSRPLQLPSLFEGKTTEAVLQMIPMLYSVCANAQAGAAVTACRQAMGVGVESRISLAESMLILCETAREHLWRILIDWPGFSGEAVNRAYLSDLPELMKQAKCACFGEQGEAFSLQPNLQLDCEGFRHLIEILSRTSEQAVFGFPPGQWHSMCDMDDFHRWIDDKATAPARLLANVRDEGLCHLGGAEITALPDFEIQSMDRRLQQPDADRFIAQPDWDATPRETSALTRQATHPLIKALQSDYGSGLMTRMAARLLELSSIPGALLDLLHRLTGEESAHPVDPVQETNGVGLGIVEAARGRLTHRASLTDGVISRYQILAPTEWNFHPEGVVAHGLLGLPAGDEAALRRQASLFINAVDPCVGYRLEFA